MSSDPIRLAVAANAQDNARARVFQRGSVANVVSPVVGKVPPKTTVPPSDCPPLPNEGGGNRECLASRITPCPQFERLRCAAQEDRQDRVLRQLQEVKRATELRERQTLLSQHVSMSDYYATLFRPPQAGVSATANASAWPSTGSLCARHVALNDVEESFIACYYRMHPSALQRKKEAEEAEVQRRQSVLAAAQLSFFAGESPGSQRLTAQRGPKTIGKKKLRGKVEVKPKEGAPAVNLRILLVALLEASDDRGLVTCDALAAALKRAPFDVHDVEAIESFFLLVRASSTAVETGDSETERRLDISNSASIVAPRVLQQGTSQRMSTAGPTGSPGGLGHPTSLTSTATLLTSGRRLAQGLGASQSIHRRTLLTPHTSKIPAAPVTPTGGGGGGPVAVTECAPPSVVRAREVLAAIDAVINGPELRDAVRSLCFDVLESDGFIHRVTLRTLRLVRREACEEKGATVTPSIVKALGDALEIMLQEEEAEYLRSQTKGKRRAKATKAAALLPHQKSAVPLHMMRRSHINLKEFTRFFDELPMVAAAFTHVWFPALFSTSRSSRKRPTTTGFNEDAPPDDDDNDNNNNTVEGTSETSCFQHGNMARRVVMERLKCMKPVSASASDGTLQR
ncbi:hypothetical protein TraAM80_09694 [Trypanosoma rangeli]|uniref:Uncharacterized protein n=1 Tax=Trypanosoma rangeli TaxID=5698 RepID=A0A3R7LG62_TRYRA|nr:uncharacterized protein TraAM80_09694 [Trypanosoma rangeli]RNE96651.1 hypothetical protein TraAM80_09694 [Trypanosoma rangeli]|eukprot:RNE96651.1 hypothetical protein TraAM80_09694 [Trypanosoma rangeli]